MEIVCDVPEREEVLRSVSLLLKSNTLLTLATAKGNSPFCSTAYYVHDDTFTLYFWSGSATRHAKNLRSNSKVAITIFDSQQRWGSLLQGLQGEGTARVVNGRELVKAGMLYLKRYPKAALLVKDARGFHAKKFESRVYKIALEKIKVFDEKAFGKEGFREVVIIR